MTSSRQTHSDSSLSAFDFETPIVLREIERGNCFLVHLNLCNTSMNPQCYRGTWRQMFIYKGRVLIIDKYGEIHNRAICRGRSLRDSRSHGSCSRDRRRGFQGISEESLYAEGHRRWAEARRPGDFSNLREPHLEETCFQQGDHVTQGWKEELLQIGGVRVKGELPLNDSSFPLLFRTTTLCNIVLFAFLYPLLADLEKFLTLEQCEQQRGWHDAGTVMLWRN